LLLGDSLGSVAEQSIAASICAHGLLAVASSQSTVPSASPRSRRTAAVAVRVLAVACTLTIPRLTVTSTILWPRSSSAISSRWHRALIPRELARSRVTWRWSAASLTSVQREVSKRGSWWLCETALTLGRIRVVLAALLSVWVGAALGRIWIGTGSLWRGRGVWVG
jgi:hypothetical protein